MIQSSFQKSWEINVKRKDKKETTNKSHAKKRIRENNQ
jgi:hypothetical protein